MDKQWWIFGVKKGGRKRFFAFNPVKEKPISYHREYSTKQNTNILRMLKLKPVCRFDRFLRNLTSFL